MEKQKKPIITIIIIITLVAVAAALIILGLTHQESPTTNKPAKLEPPKVAKKELVNGHQTNVEKTLQAQVVYKNYRFKSMGVSEQGPYYIVNFIVDNMTNESLEHTHLLITFLDSNKKVLSEATVEIPALLANGTAPVELVGVSSKTYDAFYYKVSPAKEVSLPNKQ